MKPGQDFDRELEQLLAGSGLEDTARLLSQASPIQVVADPAFRSDLRRRLLREALTQTRGRPSFWGRLFAPATMAWAGAALGILLIAFVALNLVTSPGGITQIAVTPSFPENSTVALVQPLELSFNQAMDQQSVEKAISITPATAVRYEWTSDRTVRIVPVAGDLAPNTQYQVKVSSAAETAQTHQALAHPQTITFVTVPPTAPVPTPTPKPSSGPPIGAEKPLVTLPGQAGGNWYQWSPDGSVLYFLGPGGRLAAIPAAGGAVQTLVESGAGVPSLAPDGSSILFVRGGRLATVAIKDGQVTDLAAAGQPVAATGWQGTRPLWGQSDGAYSATAGAATRIASIPEGGAIWSFAPGGQRFAYQEAHTLFLYDFPTAKSGTLGEGNSPFLGWSPDGTRAVYGAQAGLMAGDISGQAPLRLGPTDNATWADWSSRAIILVSGQGGLFAVAADGSGYHRVTDAEFAQPLFSADGRWIAYTRQGQLWTAQLGPELAPTPAAPSLDEPSKLIQDFMTARVAADAAAAGSHLDAGGRAAYAGGALALTYPADPKLVRWFTIYAEAVPGPVPTYRYTVRSVLAHGKVESQFVDETLTLIRSKDGLVIDKAAGGFPRPVGAGPEVLSVQVTTTGIVIAFDSDLAPIGSDAVVSLKDAQGKPAPASFSYSDRHLTGIGAGFSPGAQYRLTVLTSLHDLAGRPLASQFDLDLTGPAS